MMRLSIVLALSFLQQPKPATELMPYFISDGRGIAGFNPEDRELAVFALNAWARESGGRIAFTPARSQTEARVLVRWIAAGDGRFGEMQQSSPGGPAVVFVSPIVSSMGEPFASRAARDPLFRDTIVYLTCVHEIGHALGLRHTANFEDIMYSFVNGGDLVAYFLRYRNNLQSRADIPKYSGMSPNDISELKKLH